MAGILKRQFAWLAPLALAACGHSDRNIGAGIQSGHAAQAYAGPQALVLRIPRGGGAPRANAYPRTDSVVWTGDPAPTPVEVLAFDDESGSLAYRDVQGRAVLLELRLGTITVDSNPKISSLASANGSAIFGVKPDGSVIRTTPTGEWEYKPPQPASALFPEPDGELLIAIGSGAKTRLIKVFPPDRKVLEDIPFPVASLSVLTDLGDRLYLAVDSGLAVLRTRTMDWGAMIRLSDPIVAMASSPSGDRVFALTRSRNQVTVIDRFREEVTNRLDLPGKAQDLRVDPFGRYLLVRAAGRDSVWVIAIGTERVIGGVKSGWRPDLPFVTYDGTIALPVGDDVVIVDGETLKAKSRVRGGLADFWYPFLWDGFRPRAALLDEPVRFDSIPVDSAKADSTTAPTSAVVADTVAPKGFIVSFAAYIVEERARDLASRIHVGGENARVVSSSRSGQTIYRVVLGPFLTREEADRAGRESRQSYWVFEGEP
ncbi:MAG TPA: SPOR domain-containing protein [Gemmatimonadaceae bacterium]